MCMYVYIDTCQRLHVLIYIYIILASPYNCVNHSLQCMFECTKLIDCIVGLTNIIRYADQKDEYSYNVYISNEMVTYCVCLHASVST